MKFKNLNSLFKYLRYEFKDNLKENGKQMENIVRDYVERDVYSYTPTKYERTYELRDSIVTREPRIYKENVSVKVEHEPDMMSNEPDRFIHGSYFWDLTDVRFLLPYIINEGLSGDLFGEGFWTNPRPYWTNAYNHIVSNNIFFEEFKKSLTNKGIKFK